MVRACACLIASKGIGFLGGPAFITPSIFYLPSSSSSSIFLFHLPLLSLPFPFFFPPIAYRGKTHPPTPKRVFPSPPHFSFPGGGDDDGDDGEKPRAKEARGRASACAIEPRQAGGGVAPRSLAACPTTLLASSTPRLSRLERAVVSPTPPASQPTLLSTAAATTTTPAEPFTKRSVDAKRKIPTGRRTRFSRESC